MPPLLSISIISFYLSVLISLVIYFQFGKRDEKFTNFGVVGILSAFTIGSFLLLNTLALEIILASFPLFVYGTTIDYKKRKPSRTTVLVFCLISTVTLLLITKSDPKPFFLIFLLTVALNYAIRPKNYLPMLYTPPFVAFALLAKDQKCLNEVNALTILAVSTVALLLVNFKKTRIRLGYSGIFTLNFLTTALIIELLTKIQG